MSDDTGHTKGCRYIESGGGFDCTCRQILAKQAAEATMRKEPNIISDYCDHCCHDQTPIEAPMDGETLAHWCERMPREAAAEIERLREEIKRLDRLFQSLTPGGSEFVNDPERCVKFAKDLSTSQHNIIKKRVMAQREAEQHAERARTNGKRLVAALQDARRYMDGLLNESTTERRIVIHDNATAAIDQAINVEDI